MDASFLSVLWHRRSKPVGKVRQRVQDLRISSSSYNEFIASRPTLDLSHNESARLAVDCLLNQGLEGYHEMLNTEGEVDFLSDVEKNYVKENVRDADTVDPGASADNDTELESSCADSQSPTQCPAVSTDSDTTVAALDLTRLKDVRWSDPVLDKPSIKVYFQSDSKAAGMKDVVREFIRKARTALVIVMDSFSDVELLCDLLEASRRNVSVHLLLDHLNLNLFVSMWQELKLNSKNFPKLSVRSVDGQTYCAKTGRKLTGQIAESFIITDWNEALTGSYSFSWLSWQVHRSLAVLVKGSAVTPFHQEFHRLYCSSKPVPGFVTVPHTHSDSFSQSKSSQNKTMCRAWSEDAQNTQTKAKMPADVPSSGLSKLSAEFECSDGNTHPLHVAGTQTQTKPLSQIQIQTQLCSKTVVQAETPQSVSVEKPKHAVEAVLTQHDAKINVESLEKNQNQTQDPAQNQIQSHSNPLSQTHDSYSQPELTGLTITTTTTTAAENAAKPQESNTLGSLTHTQHNTVRYQSPFKTNSNLDYHNVGTETLFFQQRHRHRMTQPSGIAAGLNTQRGQWSYTLNLKQHVDFLSDNPNVFSPSMSQQKQTNTGLQFPLTHPRGHTSGLETKFWSFGTRRQDQPQRHRHLSTESPGSMSASTGMETHLKVQLQTDSKLFLPATGTKLHLQHCTSQQSARLNWNHTGRPRPVARHNSFGSAYGIGQEMGGQLGWRAFHSSGMTTLGRSKSMTE
ncbi:protein FAM83D-like [Thunnus albacares]|uniref:protein FAM83D-like n=1 Tax=Thunnus albacares TaxID=8236 RepID=UPI001CF6FD50|nr:protein FAM83D-like [Thunnus albacares]